MSKGTIEKTALVSCQSYQKGAIGEAIDRALSYIGGLDWVRAGMKIVIKPNLLMGKPPEDACTTHPAIVCALAERLIERGAIVVVGDSPGGSFRLSMLNTIYKQTRMTDVERIGARLNQDLNHQTVYFQEGILLKQLDVCQFVLEADAIINVAKLKTHGMMHYSGAVKNLFGIIPGTIKAEYHYRMDKPETFAEMLVDLALFAKPTYSFIDAVLAMEGEGPSHGNPRSVGAIIASTSPFHADIVGGALMGLETHEIPTQIQAEKRGLLTDVQLFGDSINILKVDDYKNISGYVETADLLDRMRFVPALLRKTFKHIMRPYPELDKASCIGCGECARVCPPKAIEMKRAGKKTLPDINRDTCIRCFCCQELCPKAAMHVHRSCIVRLLQK